MRRSFRKTSQVLRVQNQGRPDFENGLITSSKVPLFTESEIAYLLDKEGGGKNHYWNTKWINIGKERQYLGQWKKETASTGTWDGLGTIKFSDGSIYRGVSRKGQFEGKGHMCYSDGDIYHGEWSGGKANGKGTFISQKGVLYEGSWKDDQYHGKGTEWFSFKKGYYTGDFVDGQKTGKGKFSMDGVIYEGDFVEGQFHGNGVYIFGDESGRVYEGEFYENQINGKGVMKWADGSEYVGAFVNGRMEGYGEWKTLDGSYYKGFWKNDMRHGQNGQAYDAPSNTKIEGTWFEDEYQEKEIAQKSPWGRMRTLTGTDRNRGLATLNEYSAASRK